MKYADRVANLKAELDIVSDGRHSARTAIQTRVVEVRLALEAEDYMLAEEIATEIEALQFAESPQWLAQAIQEPAGDFEFWRMTAAAWVKRLPHAHLHSRLARTPKGATREQAQAEFVRINHGDWIGKNDFFRATEIRVAA